MSRIVFHYPVGATPLDPDEARGLIPAHLTTQAQLNVWELRNILEAEEWVFSRKHKALLSLDFMKTLHKRMFGKTWRWAGRFRIKELNLAFVAAEHVALQLSDLCADVGTQLEYKSWGSREIAARLHHRLTHIHPFPNGNGRFSRMMADLFLYQLDEPRFEWGATSLGADGDVRGRYIAALQAADRNDFRALLEFLAVNN